MIVILLAILQGSKFSNFPVYFLTEIQIDLKKKGLIIDAFGELRDQLESVKETLEVGIL